jgi:hypothetical protein
MDVFSWKFEDLKTYDINIVQHKILLEHGINLFRKKQRKFNPLFLATIEEVRKLIYAQIIIPLEYLEWVANLVPIKKRVER